MSLLVILHQTVTELCASIPGAAVLPTFVQYLIAFCSRPEIASDVISDLVVDLNGMKVRVKFGDIRLPHVVTDDDEQRPTDPVVI